MTCVWVFGGIALRLAGVLLALAGLLGLSLSGNPNGALVFALGPSLARRPPALLVEVGRGSRTFAGNGGPSGHRVAVGKMERGEFLPSTDTLLRRAGGLGMPAQELLNGLAWTPPEGVPSWGSFRVTSPRPLLSGGPAVFGVSEGHEDESAATIDTAIREAKSAVS